MIFRKKAVFISVFAVVLLAAAVLMWQRGALSQPVRAENSYGTTIDEDTTWKAGSEHEFDESVAITDGAKLTIEPGAKIIFSGDYEESGPIYFDINEGTVDAIGTEENPVVFSKANDETVFMIRFLDRSVFGSESEVHVSDFKHVRIERGGEKVNQVYQVFLPFRDLFTNIAHAEEYWQAESAVTFIYGKVRIADSIFFGSGGADIWMTDPLDTGDRDTEQGIARGLSEFSVSGSDFKGRSGVPAFMSGTSACQDPANCREMVTLTNDWYGSAKGPHADHNDGDRNSKSIEGPAKLDGFSETELFAVCHTCASNVLFLPGAKGSRLYMDDGIGSEDTLWPPNFFSKDLDHLALDENGKSVNDIYTKDVLETAGSDKIYKSFLADLKAKKDAHIINDFVPFAYDWRMNVEDVAYGFTPYHNDHVSLSDQLHTLAQSSKTGKVTIIAHSNGGLVAKELLKRMESNGEANLVDRVVFVGTPQMGAPISMLTLLYGYKENLFWGLLGSDGDIRSLAENMPGAYGFLPSAKYFDRTEDPLITFSSKNTRSSAFLDAYGPTVDSRSVLDDFLTAEKDGRDKPAKTSADKENVLNKHLLSQAEDTQDELDRWTPPSGVEAIQIAGWGLDTVSGVDYTEAKQHRCYPVAGGIIPSCVESENEYEPVYEPKFTVDGDKVVTAPSALMLSASSNVKKYWVDLYNYNDRSSTNSSHANLLEAEPLLNFLGQIIDHKENDKDLPNYIQTSRPSDCKDAKPRIRMALYSPLDVSVTDSSGNHTGPKEAKEDGQTLTTIEEGIPGSTYYQFGERKYVSFPEGTKMDIQLDGYDNGSYTLKFEEVAVTKTGEKTVNHTVFEDLPVTATTTVSLTVPKEGLGHLSTLKADLNGNEPGGEYEVAPVMNGTATLVAPPEVVVANEMTDSTSDSSGSSSGSKDSQKHDKSGITATLESLRKGIFGTEASSDSTNDTAVLPSGDTMINQDIASPEIGDSPLAWFFSIIRTITRVLFSSPFLPLNMILSIWGSENCGIGLWYPFQIL